MPRGQKSKLRSREKRRQARSEIQRLQGAKATAAEEEDTVSSSPTFCDSDPQSSLAASGSCSKSKQRQRGPAASTSACHSRQRSNSSAQSQDGERASTSQALSTTDSSFTNRLDQKAVLLVQFMLRKYNKRELITKKDLLKYVTRKYKMHFHEILRKAAELMVLAFGIDVKEVDPIKHYYALVRQLDHTGDPRMDGEIMPRSGLLMTILCVIFIKGNAAPEEDIWEVLNVMGIYAGKNHFIHGEPKKLITEDLVQEKYLEYRQVLNSDPPRYEFLWGPRAHAETSKMKVLEFLAKMHNTVPTAFPAWYEDAVVDEEERVRSRFAALFPVHIPESAPTVSPTTGEI
ncbi:melanoma-associated antigen B10-like [Lepus europaeus]|uniref:melanoma-associated antigen B10-like n=1 Tax=Lepus europaeus TaxID=9983 RepID=UPI002B45E753|nr:melanoma-associated antigen B10-like [Lepus europaeus]